MNQAKYIIIENLCGGETPILFGADLQHSEFEDLHPTSAGFWSINAEGKAYAYGKSQSLKLNSREEDSYLIDRYIKRAKE